jgi:HEAT repeat protein
LIEAALGDDHPEVRLSAVKALSILAETGNEQAFELIVASMIESQDKAQRAAAEAMAQLGPEGQAVLRDGAKDSDLIIRRASVFGLVTINETWAVELLKEMRHDDDEWLVRNAATEALAKLGLEEEEQAQPIDLSLSQPDSLAWLIAWAAERGEGTGVGEAAKATLIRALIEGETPIRHKAIDALRKLADPRTITALRQTLRDPEPSIRHAALIALDEISHRHNITISTN